MTARALIACTLLGLARVAFAEAAPAPQTPAEIWQGLSEEERQQLRERYKEFKSLTPSERDALRKRLAELRELSPKSAPPSSATSSSSRRCRRCRRT